MAGDVEFITQVNFLSPGVSTSVRLSGSLFREQKEVESRSLQLSSHHLSGDDMDLTMLEFCWSLRHRTKGPPSIRGNTIACPRLTMAGSVPSGDGFRVL